MKLNLLQHNRYKSAEETSFDSSQLILTSAEKLLTFFHPFICLPLPYSCNVRKI